MIDELYLDERRRKVARAEFETSPWRRPPWERGAARATPMVESDV